MKKLISFVLILILAFSLLSCQSQSKHPSADVDIVWLKELDFKAQYVRANVDYTPNLPYTEVIHSKDELESYIERFAVDTKGDFETAIKKYTDEFFNESQLVMCMIEETSGSIRHKVEKVNVSNDIDMSIIVNRDIPEICTDDMATWHFFVETEKTKTTDNRIHVPPFVDHSNGYYNTINYMDGPIGISLILDMDKWNYKIIENEYCCGFEIYSQETWGSSVNIIYYKSQEPEYFDDESIKTEPIVLGQYNGVMKTDTEGRLKRIKIDTPSGRYFITNHSSFEWWDKYGEEALKIFDTLALFDATQTTK